jgi:hypothetical protein
MEDVPEVAYTNHEFEKNMARRKLKLIKYRKRPVVVEALEYVGQPISELKQIFGSDKFTHPATIETLEGNLAISFGDYIIRGVEGEIYPCNPDIFKKTYSLEPDLEAHLELYETIEHQKQTIEKLRVEIKNAITLAQEMEKKGKARSSSNITITIARAQIGALEYILKTMKKIEAREL